MPLAIIASQPVHGPSGRVGVQPFSHGLQLEQGVFSLSLGSIPLPPLPSKLGLKLLHPHLPANSGKQSDYEGEIRDAWKEVVVVV